MHKELKLNINHYIKTSKNTIFSSLIMYNRAYNNPHKNFKQLATLFKHKGLFCKIFPYSPNLIRVCMECD
jgi:hypothetical protein